MTSDAATHPSYDFPDDLLQSLVHTTDADDEQSVVVTIVVGGHVISGRLVGEAAFHDAVARDMGAAGAPTAARLHEQLAKDAREWRLDADRPVPTELHLIHAAARHGAGWDHLGNFRIKLIAVVGWTYGSQRPLSDMPPAVA